MKAWVLGVFAVAGCNQIFGNHQATSFDAPKFDSGLGIDAGYGSMTLQYEILDTPLGSPSAMGIDGKAQVGTIGGPLMDRPSTNGTFQIPAELLTGPRYRVVYTPPDNVPVEFQTTAKSATFVVPLLGRLDRMPVSNTPPSEQTVAEMFVGGPNGGMSSWQHGKFFESGLYAFSDQGMCCIGLPKSVLANWASLSGPQGLPVGPNDLMILTDSQPVGTSGSQVYAYGTVKTSSFDANGNPVNPITSNWIVPPTSSYTALKAAALLGDRGYDIRAAALFTNDLPTSAGTPVLAGGVVVTDAVMPFGGTIMAAQQAGLERAGFFDLGETTQLPMRFANPFNGTDAPLFQTAVMLSGSATRTFQNTSVKVSIGVETLHLTQNNNSATDSIGDGVGLARNVAMGATNTLSDLMSSDEKVIPRASSFDVTFDSDSVESDATIDDCMVTVYQLEATTITAVRRFQLNALPTTAVPLVIDTSIFDTSHDYTLGISCYHGHPNAANTVPDWTVVKFPFAASTVYTKSFKVP